MTFKVKPLLPILTAILIGLGGLLFISFPASETKSHDDLFIQAKQIIHTELTTQSIPPIPEFIPHNPKKAALGEKLYFDRGLSQNGSVSCESCHFLQLGGTDNQPLSRGIYGQLGNLNSPTVFNSVFNASQFWDGRASDLKQQVSSPLFNPVEMGQLKWETLYDYLNQHYQSEFAQIYPQGITLDSLSDAIAEFEKTLITPNSRFDQYLKGDPSALTPDEKKGFQTFQDLGCIACHNGINLGGNLYQKAGLFEPLTNTVEKKWLGRFNVTQDPADKYFLKVPTLRNILLTAPYFHDGSIKTLEEAIKIMAKHQLGKQATTEEVALISAFLKTLTGKYKGEYIGSPH